MASIPTKAFIQLETQDAQLRAVLARSDTPSASKAYLMSSPIATVDGTSKIVGTVQSSCTLLRTAGDKPAIMCSVPSQAHHVDVTLKPANNESGWTFTPAVDAASAKPETAAFTAKGLVRAGDAVWVYQGETPVSGTDSPKAVEASLAALQHSVADGKTAAMAPNEPGARP